MKVEVYEIDGHWYAWEKAGWKFWRDDLRLGISNTREGALRDMMSYDPVEQKRRLRRKNREVFVLESEEPPE